MIIYNLSSNYEQCNCRWCCLVVPTFASLTFVACTPIVLLGLRTLTSLHSCVCVSVSVQQYVHGAQDTLVHTCIEALDAL